jgi:DNA-binding MarR family transcriptional regulator/predicted GNAT family N-acyltransferase
MIFFKEAGRMALGSRVRLLSDKITEDAAQIYSAYGTNLQPKWFPVFYVLSKSKSASVTSIAKEIGHSHVSVIKILKEMSKAGLIIEKSDLMDGRRTIVSLSADGKKISRKIEAQYTDVNDAIDDISGQAKHDLWAAVEEWDLLLSQKSLVDRVIEKKKERESNNVRIENYQPKYKDAFSKLNREWITKYFTLEKPDIEAFENPKKYILDRGGFIFVATVNKSPIGVCALVPKEKKIFELIKMAVASDARGKNIGWMLGLAAIAKAKALKADSVYLESNTILEPAIRLYQKLGFKKVNGRATPYKRCNIQMELVLKQ